MSGKKDWDSLVFALLYPVLYERDPSRGVERAMRAVVATRALDATPDEYLAAVRQALASSEQLSARFAGLLVVPHSEESIRRYLAEVERRLQRGVPSEDEGVG